MSKRNWLISLIACTGISITPLTVRAQAVLPYVPQLDSEKLELQGLQLLQDALQLIRFQQYDLALPRAELATQLAPNNYDVWFVLGSLYIQQEQLDKGIDVLKKAENLAPEQEGILFNLGNAYFQKGEYELAKEKIPELQLLFPTAISKSIVDTEHSSHWKNQDKPEALSNLSSHLYSEKYKAKIKKLIETNHWIIEESNDLKKMIQNSFS